ncbi:LytTR family DNA-binding domain-containing protein [Marimonas arenosa]|uniref:LytTR family transcriptional regulator n=1 Tax=Marimonas arenosa TaxID=1795305 RepID=A0AAE3WGK8_9RHOB|nr:LytTR family DNA-binding domain-containing protein [Marimonas arenosa]MDQ2092025.1 LytTR family transcriptional regulator [Marimonas arenosa]
MSTLCAAVLGPFGTYTQFDFPTRLFYWGIIIAVTLALGGTLRLIVFKKFADWPVLRREMIAVAIMAPVLSAVIWRLSPVLLGTGHAAAVQPYELGAYVFLIAVFGIGVKYLWFDSGVGSGEADADDGETLPRLLQRLPEEFGGEIYRLTGRDHLVEVVTSEGSTNIRMRFSDAIAEMEPIQGYCAHRSHWVTQAAITGIDREPGKIFLRLVNGDRVPVSRKYRPELEKAGLL